jgi:O-antigen ligase
VVWILTYLIISNFEKLKRIIYIQAGSVVVICIVSVLKGRTKPRLEGVIGGIYSNPNDLAFAIVLSIPFCLAFMVSSKSTFHKLLWCAGMGCMMVALFLTASRAGFIDLLISGSVCLWHFGVKGKRLYLIVACGLIGTVIMVAAGGKLQARFEALSGDSTTEQSAYGSYEDRVFVMKRALDGIKQYPLFGLGINNFVTFSGVWRQVHMTYLQIAVEGGIPALILYLLFFAHGYSNLRRLRKMKNLDPETKLFVGALHSSLIGFTVGAVFAPEAYQFFPFFAVAYTSTLLSIVNSRSPVTVSDGTVERRTWRNFRNYGTHPRSDALAGK